MNLIGDLFLLLGATFMALGALGLLRMPDVYTRIQAGTKAVTLGSLALLLGVGFHQPDWTSRLVLLVLFILLTSPVGSSTLARAARLMGLEPWTQSAQKKGDGQ